MSLNVGFNGFVYDESGNAIDAKFQAHYVRQGVWNSVRDTTAQYYSFNAGDADSLTQDGTLLSGDVVIITCWYGDGAGGVTRADRNGIFDKFAAVAITHDGVTSSYTVNIQLMPKTAPTISWTHSSTGTINRTFAAYDYSYDYYNWTYSGHTMTHRAAYYGVSIFPYVGQLVTNYQWDTNGVFDTPNTHTYTGIGDYAITIRVTNAWNLTSEGTAPIRIFYNKPILSTAFTPDGVNTPIRVTDTATMLDTVTDEDSRVTSIDHTWIVNDRTTGANISTTVTHTGTELSYNYNELIQALAKHYAKITVNWNDGFADQVSTVTTELTITNWKPIVNYTYQFLSDTLMEFTPNCSDIDGTVVDYKWDLYTLVPFTSNQYTLAKTDDLTVSDPLRITFNSVGHFKMRLTAKDDYGDTAYLEQEFDVTGGSGTCAANTTEGFSFIFPNTIHY